MKRKLNKILLVDDSEADNFIHHRVIKKADVAHSIVVKNSCKAALDYLSTKGDDGTYPTPELVLLDINMPGMNGWEFLERYEKLPKEYKAGIIVCMLTTSISEVDSQKAEDNSLIEEFLNKPLTEVMVNNVITKFFPGLTM